MCTSPKFICGSPSPQCDSIRSFNLWELMRSEFSWLGLVPLCRRPHIAAFPLPCEDALKLPSTRKQTLPRHWVCRLVDLGLHKLQDCQKQMSIVDVLKRGRAGLHFAWSVAWSEEGLLWTAGCPHLEASWPGSGVQGVNKAGAGLRTKRASMGSRQAMFTVQLCLAMLWTSMTLKELPWWLR